MMVEVLEDSLRLSVFDMEDFGFVKLFYLVVFVIVKRK